MRTRRQVVPAPGDSPPPLSPTSLPHISPSPDTWQVVGVAAARDLKMLERNGFDADKVRRALLPFSFPWLSLPHRTLAWHGLAEPSFFPTPPAPCPL